MCGPKFCSMRISHEIRDAAGGEGAAAEGAAAEGRTASDATPDDITRGMEEKAAEFREGGGEIYVRG
jgi:phosphomethylpyrimidine synthase